MSNGKRSSAAACLMFLVASVALSDPLDDALLGTWKGHGSVDTPCHAHRVNVTLFVYQRSSGDVFHGWYVESGEPKPKSDAPAECDDPDSALPGLRGVPVTLKVAGDKIAFASAYPGVAEKSLTLANDALAGFGADGSVAYAKAGPEFRYFADGGVAAWMGIYESAAESDKAFLHVVNEMLVREARDAVAEGLLDGSLRAGSDASFNPYERFHDMTAAEVIAARRPQMAAFLEEEITRARAGKRLCAECSEARLEQLDRDIWRLTEMLELVTSDSP